MRCLQRTPFYRLAKERDKNVTVAKMFWWFNQGSGADWSVTPKPHYGADGSKEFDIQTNPPELAAELKRECGEFPFFSFWGPRAGLPSSEWIARASAKVIREKKPTITLVYLPHLDYDLQRYGASCPHAAKLVGEVDTCARLVIDASRGIGARVVALSEYGISEVSYPIYVNTVLRRAGLLKVRQRPLWRDARYVRECRPSPSATTSARTCTCAATTEPVAALLRGAQGVASVLDRKAQAAFGIAHERAGDLVLLSKPEAWFAYPYWLEDKHAPDFARTVDIHRKTRLRPVRAVRRSENRRAGP
jgi:hypothetical protein